MKTMSCDNEGRDWDEVSISLKMPKIASKPEARRGMEQALPHSPQRNHPC